MHTELPVRWCRLVSHKSKARLLCKIFVTLYDRCQRCKLKENDLCVHPPHTHIPPLLALPSRPPTPAPHTHKHLWFILKTRSKAVVPVLVLLFYSTRRFALSFVLCYFVLAFFSPFSIALHHLGKRELIFVLFIRLFDLCLFGFCLFPLPLGVWEGLRRISEVQLPPVLESLFAIWAFFVAV